MTNYYSKDELLEHGFSSVGEGVKISKNCSLYAVSGEIGAGTRIDDFVILKGSFSIGEKVHICSHSSLSAVGGTITIGKLAGIGVASIFYTASDDLFKSALCGPLVAKSLTKTKEGDIVIGRGAALGGRVTVMPNSYVGNFTAIGVGGLVTGRLEDYAVYMTIKGQLRKVAKRNIDKLERFALQAMTN